MKSFVFALACFTFGSIGAAWAVPGCYSGFCGANGGGAQCQFDGETHTCGECLDGNTTVLYSGDLTEAAANAACACQHDPEVSCDRNGRMMILDDAAPVDLQPAPTEAGQGGDDAAPAPRRRVKDEPVEFLACL